MSKVITPTLSPADLARFCEFLYGRTGLLYGESKRFYIERRLKERMTEVGISQFPAYMALLRSNTRETKHFINSFTVNETYFYREDHQLRCLSGSLLPEIVRRRGPGDLVRLWSVPCSTGEEPYSLAILLHEEGLLERTILYATDINHASLDKAKQGIFPLEPMQSFTRNYQRAGGSSSFSDYYTAAYGGALFDRRLRDSITFADHSLATDAVFSETQLVSCRNVLIYFNRALQDRALGLFHESLSRRGFLGLGSKETLDFSAYADRFEAVSRPDRIYRRLGERA